MRNKVIILGFLLTAILTTACRQEKATNRDAKTKDSLQTVFRQDSIAMVKEDSIDKVQTICTFIKQMYNRGLYNKGSFLHQHCTERFIIELHYIYAQEYDGNERALAEWVFRSSVQDGKGKSRIVEVKPVGNDWYRYEFYDMGNHAINELKAYMKDNKIYMDSIRPVYDQAQAHGKPFPFTKQQQV